MKIEKPKETYKEALDRVSKGRTGVMKRIYNDLKLEQ